MLKNPLHVKALLEAEVTKRNTKFELSLDASADPLHVASRYHDEYIALVCALFAYGNAKAIVKFLSSLDFTLLDASEENIRKELLSHRYRFQNSEDIIQSLITIRRLRQEVGLNELFLQGYDDSHHVMDGVNIMMTKLYSLNPYRSYGYNFLLGKVFTCKPLSPYKRWNMFLRWMVRKDALDMGLWHGVEKKDLLIPLDTHTHKVALKLGLLSRKSYDFKAVMELTQMLRTFDKDDPIKYDFALYRLGQEKVV